MFEKIFQRYVEHLDFDKFFRLRGWDGGNFLDLEILSERRVLNLYYFGLLGNIYMGHAEEKSPFFQDFISIQRIGKRVFST